MTGWDDALKAAQIGETLLPLITAIVNAVKAHHEQTGTYPTGDQVLAQLNDDVKRVQAVGEAWTASHRV